MQFISANHQKTGVAMAKRFFEDIAEGERLDCRFVSFSKEAIVGFAGEFDPQPFHVDEKAAASSVFGGLIASSLHTLSACTRAVVDDARAISRP